MQIISKKITVNNLREMTKKVKVNFIKVVVDPQRKIMAIDAPMHADLKAALLKDGSCEQNLWGVNIYPELNPQNPDFIKFNSMINLKPSQGNHSYGVEGVQLRKVIRSAIKRLITKTI